MEDYMSEIVRYELEQNKDKIVLVFLKNGFRYNGTVLAVDDSFLKLKDLRSGVELISLSSIERIQTNGGS